MSDEVTSVWNSDVVEGYERESGGGGAGWVCRANVILGYKVFASGMSNDETFFPYKIGDEESKKKALYDAKVFKDKYNESVPAGGKKATNPSNSIRIELDKENTYLKDTSTWLENRIQDTPMWTSAYKEVIKPNLVEAGAGEGWQWVVIRWADDPYAVKTGKKVINQITGEERTPMLMYIAATFLTKEEALDYAAKAEAGEVDDENPPFETEEEEQESEKASSYPDGYDKESWETVVPLIKEALAEGTPPKQIADDYAIPVGTVIKMK